MTNDVQILKRSPKELERRDFDNKCVDGSTRRGDPDMATALRRFNSEDQRRFNRDHGDRSPCVDRQIEEDRVFFSTELDRSENDSLFGIDLHAFHRFWNRLEGRGISFGQAVFGISNKKIPYSGQGEKFSINFIPVGAVKDQPPREGGRCFLIDLLDCNKQPLAVKSLLDCLNFLNSHLEPKLSRTGRGVNEEARG